MSPGQPISRVVSGRWRRDWHLTWGRRSWTVRSWLVLLLLLGLATAYCVGWAAFVTVNTERSYHQLPPGATAEWDGVTFRAIDIHTVDTVDLGFGESGEPLDGSSWVIVVLEVSGDTAEVLGSCELDLLGPEQRLWETTLVYDDVPRRCDEDTGPGPARISLAYQVPDQFLDQLYGVVVPSDTADKAVIRP